MNLFRIRGIQLAVHASFFPLLAYVAWEGWNAARLPGLVWSVAYILLLFVCVTLHELGHSFAARRFGVGVPRILLLPIGGMAEFDSIPRQPRSEILISLAGPAVNFLIIGVLMTFVRFPENWDYLYFPLTVAELARHLVLVNAIMGTFNLIPVFPMDGGRVFRAILAIRLPYLRATEIAALVGKILAVVGAGVMTWRGQYLGAGLFLFIIVAGELERRAVKRQERDAAHWRDFWARQPPPLPVAPLLTSAIETVAPPTTGSR